MYRTLIKFNLTKRKGQLTYKLFLVDELIGRDWGVYNTEIGMLQV